jgi:hypothetical protein
VTAFPDFQAWHRQCLICHEFVGLEEEVGSKWHADRRPRLLSEWSVHPGKCLEEYEDTPSDLRYELVDKLRAHRRANGNDARTDHIGSIGGPRW